MKFDTIIIGGGLSGLVCGIRLVKAGRRCVIVSAGQSALHFSSGSFDLLNALPDGSPVECPLEALGQLALQAPEHPYVKLGEERMKALLAEVPAFFAGAGVAVEGQGVRNHYRMTPLGAWHPTWLTLKDFFCCGSPEGKLPWRKAAIFNIAGFLDFYAEFIAGDLKKRGVECSVHLFNMDALEHLRKNPSEMRSANIARVFEKQENLERLGEILRDEAGDAEVVLLPAVFGLERADALACLRRVANRKVMLLPTLLPSVPGIRTQLQLKKYFQDCGGVYMLGDTVMKAEVEEGHVVRVYSYNHGNIPFVADDVVLATGSFFSQGLIAEPGRVYEPVFGLDVKFPEEREQWFDLNFFNRQAYQSFGVEIDGGFRGMRGGKVLDNLYVAGAVLGGFNAVKEGCGGGVSILTALAVAQQIMDKRKIG